MDATASNPMTDDAPMFSALHAVRAVRDLGGGCCALEVEGPIPETLPGQFYMLRTEHRWPVLLPRPFSLYGRAPDGTSGSFLLKAVGPGTRTLAGLHPGERVWLTGPLGRPFAAEVERPVGIAGGIGLAPFLLLAEQRKAAGEPPVRLLFGGRNEAALAGRNDFEGLADLHFATDDGSVGYHGLVTGLLDDLLAKRIVQPGETVFCCGPDPMMHAVAELCAQRELGCYLSLETYMACGYGVCNGCSVEVHGDWPYSRTCQQGPVYDAKILRFDGEQMRIA